MGEAKESRYTSADFRKELERLAAEGKSVSEIVKDLGISAETVNTLKQDEKFRIGASAFWCPPRPPIPPCCTPPCAISCSRRAKGCGRC